MVYEIKRRLIHPLPAMLGYLLVGLLFACGCHNPDKAFLYNRGRNHAEPPFFTKEDKSSPVLTTNAVVRIAYEAARSNGINTESYFCQGLHFGGESTNEWIKGRWIVCFHPKERIYRHDVFVLIEDRTGKARLLSP
jgi:hypothetical protein